ADLASRNGPGYASTLGLQTANRLRTQLLASDAGVVMPGEVRAGFSIRRRTLPVLGRLQRHDVGGLVLRIQHVALSGNGINNDDHAALSGAGGWGVQFESNLPA